MSTIRQIVYVSTAIPKLTAEQLSSLLEQARKSNEKREVTGLLVYADGNIMQAIEGPHDTIGDLYRTIAADPRHKDVTVIVDIEAAERTFGNWRMAFAHEPHPAPIEQCVELIRSSQVLGDEVSGKGILGRIMAGFISRAGG